MGDFNTVLLTPGASSPKQRKLMEEYGYWPAILYLTAGRGFDGGASGRTVCPFADLNKCERPCLDNEGRARFTPAIRAARNRRTRLFFEHRAWFDGALHRELRAHEGAALRRGLTPVVRLDGTSDLGLAERLHGSYPYTVFYDYSKVIARVRRWITRPDWLDGNYHLTFSLGAGNERDAGWCLRNGVSVAVPIDWPRGREVPRTWEIDGEDWPAIDGDRHDFRFRDPRGVVVLLRAKGGSKRRDDGGFIRRAD